MVAGADIIHTMKDYKCFPTREEFFAYFPNVSPALVEELWEDGYCLEEAEHYLEWLEEKTEVSVD